jgi:undecaprenyl-diphosphatase
VTLMASIILGAVQGITEFLPISSSAHLIILPWLFHIDESGINALNFDVMLHFGTLCATLLIYGKRFLSILVEGVLDMVQGRRRDPLLLKILVATLPAGVLGLLFKDVIEEYFRVPYVTVFTLISVALLMIVAERRHAEARALSYPLALAIGFAQALALIPGTSRSGVTIVAGILLGIRKGDAVDFSFLISMPIILGTSLFEMRHLDLSSGGTGAYLAGMASALAFGSLSLKFLIEYLKKHSLDIFAFYRMGLAALILAFFYR